MTTQKKLISIVGLTASGKSSVGIKLAQLFGGEIISSDSRQVYKGLDIGSNKVTAEEQAAAPHHMLDVVKPMENFDVFTFQQMAYNLIDEIHARGKIPIIVGGTGLYSRAVIEGYDFKTRENRDKPRNDPNKKTPNTTPPRTTLGPDWQVLQIALMPPKEWLQSTIVDRIDARIEQGMITETEKLLKDGVSADWLKSLGLDYLLSTQHVLGELNLQEYKDLHAIRSMQFAKRQRTWFSREKNTIFLTNPDTFLEDSIRHATEFLNTSN